MIRTIKFWARYRPRSGILVNSYKTKREAVKNQCVGEVIVELRGTYAEGEARVRAHQVEGK